MALSCNKNISGLLRGIPSNHDGDFYCLNCFHSYRTKGKLAKHERICYDNKFCFLKLPDDDNNNLKSKSGKNFYKDISNDVDRWFDTSNFNKSDNRPLGIGKTRRSLVNLKMSLVVKS